MPDPSFQPAGIRAAAVAGSWYPDEPRHLTSQVEVMLEAAPPWQRTARLRALVVPHAGLRYSGPTAACGYLAVAPGAYQRVIVLAPSHRTPLRGVAVDPSSHYESPLGRMPVDQDALEWLTSQSGILCSQRPFVAEHAIEMQLPFLQHRLPQATLVPVLVGESSDEADFAALAASIQPLLDDGTLLVVSTDFMHYGRAFGYVPFTERVPEQIHAFDAQALDALSRGSFTDFQAVLERTANTICGRRPLGLFLHLVPRHWCGEVRAYTSSGEITGDWSHSVSYAALAFSEADDEPARLAAAAEEMLRQAARSGTTASVVGGGAGVATLTSAERQQLLRLARRSLEGVAGWPGGPADAPPTLPVALTAPRAAFVSLHRRRDGRLRGCIGWLEARGSLAEAVIENTAGAAVRDPRFEPVTAREVNELEIEISVLGPLLEVVDVEEIQIGRDGLVIVQEDARGILLPQVPVQLGWDRTAFLENVCRKAGLPAGAWRHDAWLRRFEAEVFSESDFETPVEQAT